jgi:hypothetical protein
MTAVLSDKPQGMLLVRDADNLKPMAQFFQAMLLNLLKDPGKVGIAEKLDLSVAINPTGYRENAITIIFSGGHVILQGGILHDVDVQIRCELETLLKLARVPAGPAAIKFLRTKEGKDLVNKFLRGELRIKGVARHPLGMMKFAGFLAPGHG